MLNLYSSHHFHLICGSCLYFIHHIVYCFLVLVIIILHNFCHFYHLHSDLYPSIYFHKLLNFGIFHLYICFLQQQLLYSLLLKILNMILSLKVLVVHYIGLVLMVLIQKLVIHQSIRVNARLQPII